MLSRVRSLLSSSLGLSSSIRRLIRSPAPCKPLLTCVPPQASRRFHATKTPPPVSIDASKPPTPRLVAEGGIPLSPPQVKDLFAGRFPTDCDRDVLVFKDLSRRDYNEIVHGFERSLTGRRGRPSGYLVYGGSFHTASVLRAPPSDVHDALTWNIVDLVTNTLKQVTRGNENYSFQVMTNTSTRSKEKRAAMKIPDIRIARRERTSPSGEIPPNKVVFVAEIGFTESASNLEKCIIQWFKVMPEVNVAFLIKLDERPRFSSKRAFSHFPEYVIANPQAYTNTDTAASFNQGAVEIHGVDFVGNITACLEIWRRGPDGGAEPSGERVKFYDSSRLLNPPKLELDTATFGFYPNDRQHEKLVLDWVGWDEALRGQTGELARKRFFSTLNKYCMMETEGSK
ncbi:hypothetical protein MauCBS54593_002439 [Microsporum audouinii]